MAPQTPADTHGKGCTRRVRQRAGRAATVPAGGCGSCLGIPPHQDGNERHRATKSTVFFLRLHIARDVCSVQPAPAPLQPLHMSRHHTQVCHTHRQNRPRLVLTHDWLQKGEKTSISGPTPTFHLSPLTVLIITQECGSASVPWVSLPHVPHASSGTNPSGSHKASLPEQSHGRR